MHNVVDAGSPAASLPSPLPAGPARTPALVRLDTSWAHSLEELRAVQRLRYRVFAGEVGVRLSPPPGTPPGHHADRFDAHCEHLVVRAAVAGADDGEVVGSYRVLTPDGARRAGGFHSETAFDLGPLAPLRPGMIELGRSCIHPAWRTGATLLALWSALGDFMAARGFGLAFGRASVGMRDGGHAAASLWRQLVPSHLAPAARRIRPLQPLPLAVLRDDLEVETPPLIRGYLRCGAELLGPPGCDPDFGTAELPMLLALDGLPRRHRRHIVGEIDA